MSASARNSLLESLLLIAFTRDRWIIKIIFKASYEPRYITKHRKKISSRSIHGKKGLSLFRPLWFRLHTGQRISATFFVSASSQFFKLRSLEED